MALNDAAVFTAGKGYVFVAPVGTVSPTVQEIENFDWEAGTVLAPEWSTVGHTSREDLPEFGFDGGDTETRGSWQVEVLDEVQTEVITDYVTVNLHQFDNTGLGLYYGGDTLSDEAGRFKVKGTSGKVERALTIVIVDGEDVMAFWAPRVSIRREDAISLAVDEYGALPIRATFLKYSTESLFEWISPGVIESDSV